MVQTEPFLIREAIAANLMGVWPVLVQSEDKTLLARGCKLVVGLLQDTDADIRQEMATAVSGIVTG